MKKVIVSRGLLFYIASFILLNHANCTAWLRPKGSIYTLNMVRFSTFDNDNNTISSFSQQNYMEIGLSRNLTVGLNSIGTYNSSNDTIISNPFGIALFELFLRTPIWRSKYCVVSLQHMLSLPRWQANGSNNILYNTSTVDYEMRAQVGLVWPTKTLFGAHKSSSIFVFEIGHRWLGGMIYNRMTFNVLYRTAVTTTSYISIAFYKIFMMSEIKII